MMFLCFLHYFSLHGNTSEGQFLFLNFILKDQVLEIQENRISRILNWRESESVRKL